jgi:hypothetical protein
MDETDRLEQGLAARDLAHQSFLTALLPDKASAR